MSYAFAYVIPWIVPIYEKAHATAAGLPAKASTDFNPAVGGTYLLIALAVVVLITILASVMGREKAANVSS